MEQKARLKAYFMRCPSLAMEYDASMSTENIVALYLHDHFTENPDWVKRLEEDGPAWFAIFVENRPETYYKREGSGALVHLRHYRYGRIGMHPSKVDCIELDNDAKKLLNDAGYVEKLGGNDEALKIFVHLWCETSKGGV